MKKTALTMAVLALGGLMSTQASAAPLTGTAAATKNAAPSPIEHVRDRDDRGRNDGWNHRRHKHMHRHHHRHHGHNHKYRGWHRYAYRPYNWRTRGCVIVGPVWFCP